MAKIKGSALFIIPLFIKNKFGENGFNLWLNKLEPEVKEIYISDINVSEWYDLNKISTIPTQILCDLFYNGSYNGSYELGRFSAQYALRGIYKIFFKIGSPSFLVKRASTIMNTYYDPVEVITTETEKGNVIFKITNFQDMHILIEMRIMGWIEEAVSISGGKEVSVQITKSMAKGDDSTEYLIEFK